MVAIDVASTLLGPGFISTFAGLIHFVNLHTYAWLTKGHGQFNTSSDSGRVYLEDGAFGACSWNPTTQCWYADEMLEWLEADLQAVNRSKTPWIVGYGHNAWYMNGGSNFSAIDDLAHRFGVDLVRFFFLR